MKKILFCLLAFYTPVSIVIAQNTTNSPTSMFGLGELSTGEGGQYAGLGGTGIALRGNNFLNNANPASLTELTEQRFQIDAGIMGAYQIYSQRGASNRSITFRQSTVAQIYFIIKTFLGGNYELSVNYTRTTERSCLINQCPDRISRIINHRLIPVTYNPADTNLQRGSLSYIKV